MIVRYSVSNYGCIKDEVCLSFEASASLDLREYYVMSVSLNNGKTLDLLKLGMIYGANASGKTTILKSLDFLRQIVLKPFDKKSEIFDFDPFLLDGSSSSQPTCFSLDFIQSGLRYLYEIRLTKEAVESEKLYVYNPKKSIVYERSTDREKQLASIVLGGKVTLKKEVAAALEGNTLWNNTVLGGYQKTNADFKELQEVTEWFSEVLLPIVKPKTDLYAYVSRKIESKEINKKNIVLLLIKAGFNISNISVEKTKRKLTFTPSQFLSFFSKVEESNGALPFQELLKSDEIEMKQIIFQHIVGNEAYHLKYNQESAGTKRYYQFSGLLDLLIRKKKVLPIDEVECSLHPDLLKYFFLTFLTSSEHSQLILTTHFREFLLERDIFRNDVIWFTESKADYSTDLYSLDDFDTSVIRNTSSVYKAYKAGRLGAAPELGDYYVKLLD